MILYLDIIFLLNFSFDFLLLLSTSIILRRGAKIGRLLLGAFIGSLSIFILFIKINSLQLFLFKVLISIIMILITFGYGNTKYTLKNLLYLYTSSILLGGFLYYLNVEFSYKQEGLVFYHHGLSVNFVALVILSPIIIYTYIRQGIELKNHYSNYYELTLYFNNKEPINLSGFLDTGNQLKDPYSNRPVILINNNIIDITNMNLTYIPFNAVNNNGLLKCVSVDKLLIKGIGMKGKVLVGILEDNIKMDGIDCIIQDRLLEGKNV